MQNEPPAELVEIAARILAPCLEGGRKFDQMPPDRMALRKWCREGMCSTNDATQDDALEAATAVLSAVTPLIEARVVGKIVAWLEQWADNEHPSHFAEAEALRAAAKFIRNGDYRSASDAE